MENTRQQEARGLLMSTTIGKLTEALSKAQGAFAHAAKDTKNEFFKSRYADLASVISVAKKPLSENGLAVIQTTDFDDSGRVYLLTTLSHTSGEWISGRYPIEPMKKDPQGFGSATTYARRYMYSAITGIAQDDDDGNEAQKHEPVKKTYAKEPHVQRHSDEMTAKCKAYAEAVDVAPDLETLEKHVKDNAVFMNEVFDKEPSYHARLTAKLNAKRKEFENETV